MSHGEEKAELEMSFAEDQLCCLIIRFDHKDGSIPIKWKSARSRVIWLDFGLSVKLWPLRSRVTLDWTFAGFHLRCKRQLERKKGAWQSNASNPQSVRGEVRARNAKRGVQETLRWCNTLGVITLHLRQCEQPATLSASGSHRFEGSWTFEPLRWESSAPPNAIRFILSFRITMFIFVASSAADWNGLFVNSIWASFLQVFGLSLKQWLKISGSWQWSI